MSRQRPTTRRRLQTESLDSRQLLAANIFHNERMPEDVNQDGRVSALDALIIVNEMNLKSNGLQTDEGQLNLRGRMTDVNNDARSTAMDVLLVINRLSGVRDPSDDDCDDNAQDGPDVVLAWNDFFVDILSNSEPSQHNPGYASRSTAMLNLAIYDAVAVATEGTDAETFYDYPIGQNCHIQLSAAVTASQAAHTVLSGLYPAQHETLDAFLRTSLAEHRSHRSKEASLTLGSQIGSTILAIRAHDGSEVVGMYEYTDEPGYFQPDPLHPNVPAWGLLWGEVDTFAINSTDEFKPNPPPVLTSQEYADSYNDVLELGSVDSAVRTAEQTEIGLFWAYDRYCLGTPIALYNDVLAQIAQQQGNTMRENAALFAQASVAMADAAIVVWDTKFSEEFWRPVTAIHSGDIDGNDLTEGDADWIALGAPNGEDLIGFTPPFPAYVSGHATFGGALFATLQEFYGTDDIAYDLSSIELAGLLDNPELQEAYGLELDDAIRSFDSFSEAMAENGRSRIYLGIHFDFDDIVGQQVGSAIAASITSNFAVAEAGRPGDDGDRGQNVIAPMLIQ
jgi:Dockerin type I domain/PAP2 superfamily/Planctomycete extracellular